MSDQEINELTPQQMVDIANKLNEEAKTIEAQYEDEKKAAHEKHKAVTQRIKDLVQPLLDEISIIKDYISEWRSSNTDVKLDGCSFRPGKFKVVAYDLDALVKAAAEDKRFMRYLSLNEKTVQKTLDDREDLHGIPGINAKREPDSVVLRGGK